MNKIDTIVTKHKKNFETLKKAFKNKQVALMECIENSTGEKVAVICTVEFDGKEYNFTPFAKFFNDNPFELLTPPM